MSSLEERLLDGFFSYLRTKNNALVGDFLGAAAGRMERREVQASVLPVTRFLDRAVAIAGSDEARLVGMIAGNRESLAWRQTYSAADFGASFLENYGWTELFGTRGVFANDRMAGGFLILGPDTRYPDHHHVAEEIYIPLTGGAFWKKGEGAYQERRPGEIIHHPSGTPHAMRTMAEPLLALYLWRGGDLAQKSTISHKSIPKGAANG